jgi:hypothetical protein
MTNGGSELPEVLEALKKRNSLSDNFLEVQESLNYLAGPL